MGYWSVITDFDSLDGVLEVGRNKRTLLAGAVDDSRLPMNSERLTDKAYRALEEMIVTLQLPPGSTWSESVLSEMVGIGRTPVRQALQRLGLEQLVEVVPRFGVIVTEVIVPEQILVVEMRRVLDPLIASRAARRSNSQEKVDIARYADELIEVASEGNVLEYLRLHFKIRLFEAECTRNKFLKSAMAPLDALSRRFFYLHQSKPAQIIRAAGLHAKVLRSIASDDEATAVVNANTLLDYIEEFTRAAIIR